MVEEYEPEVVFILGNKLPIGGPFCCVAAGKPRTVTTFKLKTPAKNPVLHSNGVQCEALILKTNSLSLFTAQLCASCLHMFTPTPVAASWCLLEKEEYYASLLEAHCRPYLGANVPPFLSKKGYCLKSFGISPIHSSVWCGDCAVYWW